MDLAHSDLAHSRVRRLCIVRVSPKFRRVLLVTEVVLLTSNDPAGPNGLPRALADRLDGSVHLRCGR